jgi:hypothetical protein
VASSHWTPQAHLTGIEITRPAIRLILSLAPTPGIPCPSGKCFRLDDRLRATDRFAFGRTGVNGPQRLNDKDRLGRLNRLLTRPMDFHL